MYWLGLSAASCSGMPFEAASPLYGYMAWPLATLGPGAAEDIPENLPPVWALHSLVDHFRVVKAERWKLAI